jgi:hypothetical protein
VSRTAKIRTTSCCPVCFGKSQQDDSILMLISGAAVVGDGVHWAGNLDHDIDKISA